MPIETSVTTLAPRRPLRAASEAPVVLIVEDNEFNMKLFRDLLVGARL